MPITYPANRQEVVDRINTDVQNELPQSDPFIRNSALSSICIGYGGAVYDLNVNQENLQKELFPDTSTGQYAQIWGTMKGITPNAATPSTGMISITGNAGVTILTDQLEVQSSTGFKYKGTAPVTIAELSRDVLSIVRDGNVATVTTTDDHNLASTDTVTISGAVQTEYNITTTISVTGSKSFTYIVSGTPTTPATGTIFATSTNAIAQVTCESSGSNTNLSNGSSLSFSTVIAGVNSIVHVTYDGIVGGTDNETDISYRSRYLNAYRNPFALFNDSSIISYIKQNNYVSRIWVFDITPAVGQVTIYFMVYDSDGFNAIPSPAQVATIHDQIVDYNTGIKPANTDPNDVIVSAPIPIQVDFIFTAISPDTESMREAITNSLRQALGENAQVSQNFPAYAYNSAIWQTIDPVDGSKLDSFTLTSPAGDILIGTGELAVFGDITFP